MKKGIFDSTVSKKIPYGEEFFKAVFKAIAPDGIREGLEGSVFEGSIVISKGLGFLDGYFFEIGDTSFTIQNTAINNIVFEIDILEKNIELKIIIDDDIQLVNNENIIQRLLYTYESGVLIDKSETEKGLTREQEEQKQLVSSDSQSNWQTKNPVLEYGEIGQEIVIEGQEPAKQKIGDGVRAWNDLPYSTISVDDVDSTSFIINNELAKEDEILVSVGDGASRFVDMPTLLVSTSLMSNNHTANSNQILTSNGDKTNKFTSLADILSETSIITNNEGAEVNQILTSNGDGTNKFVSIKMLVNNTDFIENNTTAKANDFLVSNGDGTNKFVSEDKLNYYVIDSEDFKFTFDSNRLLYKPIEKELVEIPETFPNKYIENVIYTFPDKVVEFLAFNGNRVVAYFEDSSVIEVIAKPLGGGDIEYILYKEYTQIMKMTIIKLLEENFEVFYTKKRGNVVNLKVYNKQNKMVPVVDEFFSEVADNPNSQNYTIDTGTFYDGTYGALPRGQVSKVYNLEDEEGAYFEHGNKIGGIRPLPGEDKVYVQHFTYHPYEEFYISLLDMDSGSLVWTKDFTTPRPDKFIVGPNGKVHLIYAGNGLIQRLNADGVVEWEMTIPLLNYASSMFWDDSGDLYVCGNTKSSWDAFDSGSTYIPMKLSYTEEEDEDTGLITATPTVVWKRDDFMDYVNSSGYTYNFYSFSMRFGYNNDIIINASQGTGWDTMTLFAIIKKSDGTDVLKDTGYAEGHYVPVPDGRFVMASGRYLTLYDSQGQFIESCDGHFETPPPDEGSNLLPEDEWWSVGGPYVMSDGTIFVRYEENDMHSIREIDMDNFLQKPLKSWQLGWTEGWKFSLLPNGELYARIGDEGDFTATVNNISKLDKKQSYKKLFDFDFSESDITGAVTVDENNVHCHVLDEDGNVRGIDIRKDEEITAPITKENMIRVPTFIGGKIKQFNSDYYKREFVVPEKVTNIDLPCSSHDPSMCAIEYVEDAPPNILVHPDYSVPTMPGDLSDLEFILGVWINAENELEVLEWRESEYGYYRFYFDENGSPRDEELSSSPDFTALFGGFVAGYTVSLPPEDIRTLEEFVGDKSFNSVF